MTSFVNIKYSAQHHGAAAPALPQGSSEARGLSMLLLSAMVAAVMGAAYEVMDSVAEGHLLVMWVALWAVAFATLALFGGVACQMATRLKNSLDVWSHTVAQARADQRLWATAQADPRVMADLQAAMMRDEARTEAQAARAARALKLAGHFGPERLSA